LVSFFLFFLFFVFSLPCFCAWCGVLFAFRVLSNVVVVFGFDVAYLALVYRVFDYFIAALISLLQVL
jgi:hypothetical protein